MTSIFNNTAGQNRDVVSVFHAINGNYRTLASYCAAKGTTTADATSSDMFERLEFASFAELRAWWAYAQAMADELGIEVETIPATLSYDDAFGRMIAVFVWRANRGCLSSIGVYYQSMKRSANRINKLFLADPEQAAREVLEMCQAKYFKSYHYYAWYPDLYPQMIARMVSAAHEG